MNRLRFYVRTTVLSALLMCLTFGAPLLLLSDATAAARTTVLGSGTPPAHRFSGYVARNGAELGIARLSDGTWGICLDTGLQWRWPSTTPRSKTVADSVVGYLTATYLSRARRDPRLAAALWWAVGERLNSHPGAVRSHVRRMRRESPAIGRAVTALHRTLVRDAALNAPPAGGYLMPGPVLDRTTLSGIGLRSASGRWVPGLPTVINLHGATFDHGLSTWSGRTSTAALAFPLRPSGPVTITADVRVSGVPTARFTLYTPRNRHRQRVATSVRPTSVLSTALVPFTPARPTVRTQVNLQRASSGATVADRVQVSGLSSEPGAPAVGLEWQLFGPVRADARSTCRRASWRGAPLLAGGTVAVSTDGTVTVGAARVSRGGCYSYRERLLSTPYSIASAWTPLGIVEETTLITPASPRIPGHPAVASGGESNGPSAVERSRTAPVLSVPAVSLKAPLSRVDFAGRTLTPPRSIASGGIWRRGAGLDEVAGTTVLVGHVSDNHDRPGAFKRLGRARLGQMITVRTAQGTSAWKITAIRRVDRTRLPRQLFTQRVTRRLVLITCTDRVTTRSGGFHYTKNLIIEAVPR